MAASAGVFTPSDNYADYKVAQEMVFADPNRIGKQFDTPIGTLLAVSENSNYTIADDTPLRDAWTNRTVTVYYPEKCSETVVDASSTAATCTIDGDEMGTDSASFDKNYDKYVEIEVRDDRQNNLYSIADEIAYRIELAKRELENDFNSTILSTIDSNIATTNDYGDLTSGTYDPGTGIITYDPASWNADLIAEFDLMANVNQIDNPVFLHGTNLYKEVFLAANKECCDNQGDRNLFGVFGHYWDARQFITTYGTSTKPSYLIEPNSVVIWNSYQFQNDVPQHQMDAKNTHTWREGSSRINTLNGQPFYFDILWQRDCAIVDDSKYGTVHQIRVHLRGGIDIAPNNCSAGSGILKFLNA